MNRREFTQYLCGAAGALMLPSAPPRLRTVQLLVDGARLNEHMGALAQFGKTPAGGVSRVAYTEADLQGRAFVLELMRNAALEPSIDAVGNIIGRRAGRDADLPPLLMGSHIDSVPDGGNYDGNVGSLSAIEVAWTLADHNHTMRHPLEVVVFQNEEGGLYGSRGMAGTLPTEELDQVSQSGKTIREGIAYIGGDPSNLDTARREPGEIAAYMELHIEQGGSLDAQGIDIGVVEGIVGINWWDVAIEGFANHAGTTPMDQRRDALRAAAQFIEAVNRVVRSVPGRQVGTVGQIEALPGAPNVIPGRVTVSLEIRDLDRDKIWMLYDRIRGEAARIADSSGTAFTFTDRQVNIVPEPTDERVRQVIAAAADGLGLTKQFMPSGAGHDAQSIAALAPVGMIFIPSVGGISHSPRELSRPQDIVNGANVLLRAALALDDMGLAPAR